MDSSSHHHRDGVTQLDMSVVNSSSPWMNSLTSPSLTPSQTHSNMTSTGMTQSLGSSAYFSSFNSILSPTNGSAGISATFASNFHLTGALRDPALNIMPPSFTHSTSIGSRTLTPLLSPLTPAPTAFGHSNLFAHANSASSMLDVLSGSNSNMNSTESTTNVNDDAPMDDGIESEEEEEEGVTGRTLVRATTSSQNTARATSTGHQTEGEVDEDEADDDSSYHDDGDQAQEEDESDMETDEAGGLVEWVEQSQRSGVPPQTVLQRLLADYSHLPISHNFLWKTAFNLSLHIQQHLVREAVRRQKLSHVNSMDDVVSLIQKSSRIVVLSGAGISVSAGIPDFRSKQGIYPRLKREFGMSSPEAMFDLEYFRANPSCFYSFAKELWPGSHQPTIAHRFIAMLEKQGKLLRNYTQNIDALELRAGIKNVLQCHGSFATAKCVTCGHVVHGMSIHKEIMAQKVAKCKLCWPPEEEDVSVESLQELDENGLDRTCKTFGVIKPEITFFGESLPESFRTCLDVDRDSADLVIVMGSSLKVQPVAGMLQLFKKSTPMVLINREVVGKPDEFDVEVLGMADEICAYLAHKLQAELPEVDPDWVIFVEKENVTIIPTQDSEPNTATTEGTSVSSPASTSTTLTVPQQPAPSNSNLAAPPQLLTTPTNLTLARPLSPMFVPPNRYLFGGAHSTSSPIPSDTSSAQDSVSLPDSMADDGEHDGEGVTCLNGGPLSLSSPKPTNVYTGELQSSDHTDFQSVDLGKQANGVHHPVPMSPMQSPRTPLGLSSPAKSTVRPPPLHVSYDPSKPHHAISDDQMVCTPTRSTRYLLLSPQLHAMASPKLKSAIVTPRDASEVAPSWIGKRKSTADSQDASTTTATSSTTTDTIHQPEVKRRKISAIDEKCDGHMQLPPPAAADIFQRVGSLD